MSKNCWIVNLQVLRFKEVAKAILKASEEQEMDQGNLMSSKPQLLKYVITSKFVISLIFHYYHSLFPLCTTFQSPSLGIVTALKIENMMLILKHFHSRIDENFSANSEVATKILIFKK